MISRRDYIAWIQESLEIQEGGASYKSRDMGISITSLAWSLHRWIFYKNQVIGLGSVKEDRLDKRGDPDALFPRFRMLVEALPSCWVPRDSKGKAWSHRNKDLNTNMLILNPVNGSVIRGEGGENIGRGGRSTIYFVDELDNMPVNMQTAVVSSLSANTNVKVFISTPKQRGSQFYKMCMSGNHRVFKAHWRLDPRKDDEWYEKQKKLYDPVIVAQEIDLLFDVTHDSTLIPEEWIDAAITLGAKLDGADSGQWIVGYDVGGEGKDNKANITRRGFMLHHIDEWTGIGLHRVKFAHAGALQHVRGNVHIRRLWLAWQKRIVRNVPVFASIPWRLDRSHG